MEPTKEPVPETAAPSNPKPTAEAQDKGKKAAKEPKKKKETTVVAEEEYVNTTPKGEKKDMNAPMAPAYKPKIVEAAWSDWWEECGFFKADNQSQKPKYVIVIPPPNVTGSLHLGHALTNSVQDSLVRWHRMRGYEALWVPGIDHAGIATQAVVEKKIWKESKLTRHDLGREEFVKKVWEWKNQYGNRIFTQLRRLGSSLDWSRERFTMDEMLSKAVNEAFVRLYEAGLIYRDTRLVHWCCTLKTAISDMEVEYVTVEKKTRMKVPGYGEKTYEFGVLTSFSYKIVGSDEEIIVATTRPETMLGDTAVAVHPEDPRYKHLHGKLLQHPFVDRQFPIITDSELVDMNFGTGAVKVTPAHDPNDYLCGKRHNLEFINILNVDGTLNEKCGKFTGMKRFDARVAVIQALKEIGSYKEEKDNAMRLGLCSRSNDIIEPLLLPQWYVSCKGMAEASAQAARSKELEIVPEWHEDTWYRWLDNIRDWCISRQLWWGHRIPAYRVSIPGVSIPESERWVVSRTQEEALKTVAEKYSVDPATVQLEQDPDVLDTWFSSGLFPFSVFGWPNETEDFKAFYPTSVLETGHDILFFWVARMVMMGLQLTGKLPFKKVLLHAMVRDAHGRKMSKSLGNVIDPLDVIEGISLEGLHKKLEEGNLDPREVEKAKQGQKADYPSGIPECGTDALRFALCAYTSQGRDINLDINRVVGYRNFCNKLWNATKFALMNLGPDFAPAPTEELSGHESYADLWILSRLSEAAAVANKGFDEFDLSASTTAIYNFWYYELCDVYLELLKPVMNADPAAPGAQERKSAARNVLYTCLDNGLRLIHPYMPFVSEELYQRLPRRPTETHIKTIMLTAYPEKLDAWTNRAVETAMAKVQDIVHGVRSLRASVGLASSARISLYVQALNQEYHELASNYATEIKTLTLASNIEVLLKDEPPIGCAINVINDSCNVHIMLKGLIDIDAEIVKLEKKLSALETNYASVFAKTQAAGYEKVPENVRKQNSEKLTSLEQEIASVKDAITKFQSLKS
eukprot:TRINITY_DN909_c0_g1_i2.p1 TRINITY_DN909_c0_g1~~TRINITY_DN909_c0_g1_i2.p1  ORF type:complete len:1026 (+),score=250.34 TRINITY_DN909_c0_g1_i2:57-3134(+)